MLLLTLFCIANSNFSLKNADVAREAAQKLLNQMTLDEKISLLHGVPKNHDWGRDIIGYVPGIPRLGIPDIRMNDGPQGYRCDFCHGTSTAFPSGLTVAASWNPSNAYAWGQAMGQEFYDKGSNIQLGPGMNIARIPRCGRNFEYISGEDPTLGKVLAPAAIRGIQDTGIIAVAKHYINNNQEFQRFTVIASMDWKTHMELYSPMFEASITEGKVASFMCSYNKLEITGTPADETNWSCQNKLALTKQLREMWKFDGWVMSDWDGTHSTVLAANAGLDQEMGLGRNGVFFGEPLKRAVNNGKVSQDTINTKVMNILYQMERFGLMERQVSPDHGRDVTSDAHNAIARNVATEGIVLLKNENSILPMKSGSKVSVMGAAPVGGGGSGAVTGPYVIDGKKGVSNSCPDCVIIGDNQGAEYIVYLIGTNSAEAVDRPNLSLPSNDLNILQGLIQKGMGGKLIVVVTNPGAVLLPFSKDVAAVMLCFMPGQEFGNAVGNVLFGVVNPSGKLPITIPNIENEMKMDQMQYPGVNGKTVYSEGLLVGYRWYDVNGVNPLYEFGFGLSYSSFSLSSDSAVANDYSFTVDVTNDGKVDGAEVVQIYLVTPNPDPSPTTHATTHAATPPKKGCEAMLKRLATDHSGANSCESRIKWLKANKHMSTDDAYAQVAKEFPNICVCDDRNLEPIEKPGNCAGTQDQCGGSNGSDRLLDSTSKMKQLKAFEKVFVKAGETKTVKFQLKPRDFQSFDMVAGDWKTVSGRYTAYYGTSSRKLSGKFAITVGDSGELIQTPKDTAQIKVRVDEEQNLYF